MTPNLSADARAVVRAADALTTQVRRIADALTTGADAPTTTADDGPRIARPVPVATTCGHCGHPYNWHASSDACEFGNEEIGCGCDTFTVGERPEPMDPWRILGAEAPAADEDTQRWTRRESINIVLSRVQRGLHISSAEADLLRQHVETEIREHDPARSVARSNLRHVKTLVPELEAADRIRAEAQRDRDQHAAVLAEVLRQFTHETHPGRRCLQSGHVPVETVERWRSVVAPTVERPWWQQVDEARAELEQAQAAIERVRAKVAEWRDWNEQETAWAVRDIEDALANAPAPEPLDGTEQPTTTET